MWIDRQCIYLLDDHFPHVLSPDYDPNELGTPHKCCVVNIAVTSYLKTNWIATTAITVHTNNRPEFLRHFLALLPHEESFHH